MAFTTPEVYRVPISATRPWIVDYHNREFLYILSPVTLVLYSDVIDQGPAIFAPNQLQMCPFRNSDRVTTVNPSLSNFYVITSDDVIGTAGEPVARDGIMQANIDGYGLIASSKLIASATNNNLYGAMQIRTDGMQTQTVVITSITINAATMSIPVDAYIEVNQTGNIKTDLAASTTVAITSLAGILNQSNNAAGAIGSTHIIYSQVANGFTASPASVGIEYEHYTIPPNSTMNLLHPYEVLTMGTAQGSTIRAYVKYPIAGNAASFTFRFFVF